MRLPPGVVVAAVVACNYCKQWTNQQRGEMRPPTVTRPVSQSELRAAWVRSRLNKCWVSAVRQWDDLLVRVASLSADSDVLPSGRRKASARKVRRCRRSCQVEDGGEDTCQGDLAGRRTQEAHRMEEEKEQRGKRQKEVVRKGRLGT